jgi:inosine-uridine nucleoside N-ribohydrolase
MMNARTGLSRRRFISSLSTVTAGAVAGGALIAPGRAAEGKRSLPTPVILATDIGDDIDDTWALGFLLKSPELDLKLAVGDYGKREYRAKLLAKFLQTTGHGNVPIGLGLDLEPRGEGPQGDWVKDYSLSSYPGTVHQDGVQAMIDTILSSREPVTVIAIGPMPNVAAALKREPRIARQAQLVGMYGSVHRGYDGSDKPSAEWNVKADPKACQAAFTAPWDITITPLDTCGVVTLEGERYQRVRDSKDAIASTIIENYRLWSRNNKQPAGQADRKSSTLFDTVAVYLAISRQLCRMERVGLRVTDEGFTVIDPAAKKINAATGWKDLDAYREFLVTRLTGS